MAIGSGLGQQLSWFVEAAWIAVMLEIYLGSGIPREVAIPERAVVLLLVVAYLPIALVQWRATRLLRLWPRIRICALTGACAYLSIVALAIKALDCVDVLRAGGYSKEVSAMAVQRGVPAEYMTAWRRDLQLRARDDLLVFSLLAVSTCLWYRHQMFQHAVRKGTLPAVTGDSQSK
jgi:hypothetical protein